MCSEVGAGDNEGPAAAWWEAWEDTQPSERKRKFPTSRPTPDDEKEDASLADMSVEVEHTMTHLHFSKHLCASCALGVAQHDAAAVLQVEQQQLHVSFGTSCM